MWILTGRLFLSFVFHVTALQMYENKYKYVWWRGGKFTPCQIIIVSLKNQHR